MSIKHRETVFHRLRCSPTFVLTTICLAIFNDVFLFGALIPILPYALQGRFKLEENDLQKWISVLMSAYGATLLLGSLLFGWLGDTAMSRRPLFLLGLVMLTLATALLAWPGHVTILVIGRILQGLSAAVVWTSGLALITETFGKAKFGEMLGYVLSCVSIGSTAAPLLGALVYSKGGYQAVTVMTLGTVVLALGMRLLWVEDGAVHAPKITVTAHDRPNSPQSYSSDSEPQGHQQGTEHSCTHQAHTNESDFLFHKHGLNNETTHPASYLMLLRSPRILADLWGLFTYACVTISFETLLPTYAKATFQWNSAHSGLMFLAWVLPGFLAPVAGKLSDRFGPRWIVVGAFSAAVPPLLLLRLITERTTLQQILLLVLLILTGIALAFVMPPLLSDMVSVTKQMKQTRPDQFGNSEALAQVYALFLCSWSSGALLGPALAGFFEILTGWGGAMLTLAIICAVACGPVICFLNPEETRRDPLDEF